MSARRRPTPLPLAAILIVLAGSSLAACGNSSNDSKLLSPTSASELRSTLAQVEQTVENGDCGAAQEQVDQLEQQITSLDRVEADLRDALASGVSRLQQLVTEECQTATAETGATGATGPAETGGTTAPDEQQSDEPGNSEGKGKGKKKGHFKDEGGGDQQEEGGDEESGGSGDAGTTGSGGSVP